VLFVRMFVRLAWLLESGAALEAPMAGSAKAFAFAFLTFVCGITSEHRTETRDRERRGVASPALGACALAVPLRPSLGELYALPFRAGAALSFYSFMQLTPLTT
jgi:hypothetical protein